jgi:hypothetical protein
MEEKVRVFEERFNGSLDAKAQDTSHANEVFHEQLV